MLLPIHVYYQHHENSSEKEFLCHPESIDNEVVFKFNNGQPSNILLFAK